MPTKIHPAQTPPYHHGDLRHALIDMALQLVTEEQDWGFSLREVARRAGVSHRAPYNHFPEKLDLLAAVAAVGFERLRDGLRGAMVGIDEPEAMLVAICRAYIRLGLENPALYRLMFGPALSDAGSADRPPVAKLAGAQARGVLEEVILRGARSGAFAVLPDGPQPDGHQSDGDQSDGHQDVALAALSVWSTAHGLTMLVIDKIPRADLAVDDIIERVLGMVVVGLRRGHAEASRQRESARSPARPPTPSNAEPGALSALPPGQMVRRTRGVKK
jgi:AcrR family transcriptional regulator